MGRKATPACRNASVPVSPKVLLTLPLQVGLGGHYGVQARIPDPWDSGVAEEGTWLFCFGFWRGHRITRNEFQSLWNFN